MPMIKRGHSDSGRPSVVSSTRKCSQCGHFDSSASTCPMCNGKMVNVVVVEKPESDRPSKDDCPGGICEI